MHQPVTIWNSSHFYFLSTVRTLCSSWMNLWSTMLHTQSCHYYKQNTLFGTGKQVPIVFLENKQWERVMCTRCILYMHGLYLRIQADMPSGCVLHTSFSFNEMQMPFCALHNSSSLISSKQSQGYHELHSDAGAPPTSEKGDKIWHKL